jgi:tetratricopeptide (TPR) repeat protein
MDGAYADARARTERILPTQEKALGSDHPRVAATLVLLANVLAITGEPTAARPLYDRALAIHEKALGPEHAQVAEVLWRLGELDLTAKRPAEALPRLERAVALFTANAGTQIGEYRAHFSLARALLPGDRARALAEAHTARDGLRDHGTNEAKQLAEVERWLAEHE